MLRSPSNLKSEDQPMEVYRRRTIFGRPDGWEARMGMIEARGDNKTNAMKAVQKVAVAALSGSYEPVLLHHRGWSILIYRDPLGWRSGIVYEGEGSDKPGPRAEPYCFCSSNRNRQEEIESSCGHLAQLAWKPEHGSAVPDIIATYPRQVSNWRTWVDFQLRYAAARGRGLDDKDCFDYAARNPLRADLWMEEDKAAGKYPR